MKTFIRDHKTWSVENKGRYSRHHAGTCSHWQALSSEGERLGFRTLRDLKRFAETGEGGYLIYD